MQALPLDPVSAQLSAAVTSATTLGQQGMPRASLAILFVCMGNICRSPTAEGVFAQHAARVGLQRRLRIDSAGTHNYHPGSPPDARSQKHAARRGYDLSALRARQILATDFDVFDLILAMDWDNLALLQDQAPPYAQRKLRLLMDFAPQAGSTVVPDPYSGGAAGFEQVLDLIEQASVGLLRHAQAMLQLPPVKNALAP